MQLSFAYVLFLAVVLPLYFVLPRRFQGAVLLAASLAFYAFGGWQALAVMAGLCLLNYGMGRALDAMRVRGEQLLVARRADGSWDKPARLRYRDALGRRLHALLALGIALNVGCLLLFKLALPTRLMGAGRGWLAPMGLSFVTLSLIGYLVDVCRGHVKGEQNLFRFALFTFYFPQMWQGPINRYATLAPRLLESHSFNGRRAAAGAVRVLWGAFKKLAIADTVAVAVRAILERQSALGGAGMWALTVLYTVQIYSDFTGGMDMALGVSQIMGIALEENFDRPFGATSLKDYWRRWHRTMGRWFEDYVFYPLSVCRLSRWLSAKGRAHFGQRVGKYIPLIFSMLLTWCATGLWHGVSWNFLLWGLFNGVFLLLSQLLRPCRERLRARFSRFSNTKLWQGVLCLGTVFTAGLFRTLDLNARAGETLRLWVNMLDPSAIVGLTEGAFWQSLGLDLPQWILLGLGVLLMARVGSRTPRLGADEQPLRERIAARPLLCGAVLAGLLVSVLILGQYGLGYEAGSFIYGEF